MVAGVNVDAINPLHSQAMTQLLQLGVTKRQLDTGSDEALLAVEQVQEQLEDQYETFSVYA